MKLDKDKYLHDIKNQEFYQAMLKVLDQVEAVLMKHEIKVTDFLNPYYAKKIMNSIKAIKGISFKSFVGHQEGERQAIVLAPDYIDINLIDLPIAALEITCSSQFHIHSHGDFMGAILGLGIKREKIGDIILHTIGKKYVCQIVIHNDMKDYVLMSLEKVGRSNVEVKEISFNEIRSPKVDYSIINGNVASLRLDAVIAVAYNLSRSQAHNIIGREQVSVNWELIQKSDYEVKNGDIISVKGMGRAIIANILGATRSGRIKLQIKKPL